MTDERCEHCGSRLLGEQIRRWHVVCCEVCWDAEDAYYQDNWEALWARATPVEVTGAPHE